MRFSILGPLEIRDDAGDAVTFTRPLHRAALSVLLLKPGQPNSSASLVSAIWGDEPPLSPDVSLRSCVYGIRKLLPDPGRLRTHPSGYLIVAGPGELDAEDFSDFATRGRDALDAGQPRQAAALLGRALSQWREPPLADVPRVPARDRLLALRQDSRDALVDARLALGEHRQVLAELRAAVTAEPLREHPWAQLITALYRSGSRAEALAAFGRLRVTLVSAYGIDPGPELQDLHRRILADDPSLTLPPQATDLVAAAHLTAIPPDSKDWVGFARDSPTKSTQSLLAGSPSADPAAEERPGAATAPGWRTACQLPAVVADFTGREAELGWLRTRLPGTGMTVTVITGMLGTGKSALAVRAAHQAAGAFPDGQLYACLDDDGQPRDPQVVLAELLRGVGVPSTAVPDAGFEREALYRSALAGRRVLVVADGATSAAQVRPLLPGTAGAAVLVTTRSRLPDLDGARSLELAGLDPADSVTLLERVSGRDQTDADASAAGLVAVACGHLPLALRIAGIRLADDPGLSTAALACSLSDDRRRLDELEVGGTSVRGRLGAAAQAVSGPARRALALLAEPGSPDGPLEDVDARRVAPELADAGLLRRAGHDDSGALRYWLHPLVLAYAGELLAAARTESLPGRPWSAELDLPEVAGPPRSSLMTTRVGERRTTSVNPAPS